MKLNNAALTTPGLARYVQEAGFATPGGELDTYGRLGRYPGEIRMSDEYIAQSGGLMRAVSRKAAQILRGDLQGLDIRQFPEEITANWRHILLHSHPHMDEYLAAYLLRSCLPDSMHTLTTGETALYSRTDDAQAKATWPHAAVLGVGNVVNGGAQAMLLFDEHEAGGEEKTISSLVMLMKRYMLGTQKPPYALYQLLREVDHIDQYGTSHPKALSTYTKFMQNTPLHTIGDEFMCAEWKTAVVDACLAAFYLALKTPGLNFRNKLAWLPMMRASLEDFAQRTALRHHPDFDAAYRKISNFMTDSFAYRAARGDTKYLIPAQQNLAKTTEAEFNMLTPYLPLLCFRFWGGALGQLLLCPLWECRFYSEMLNTANYRALRKLAPAKQDTFGPEATGIGRLTVRTCRNTLDSLPVKIIEYAPAPGQGAPAPVNQYIRTELEGCGLSIFRNTGSGTMVIGKSEKIPAALWEMICDRLVALEGLSDDLTQCGAWHVTRNPAGLAPFLLNGNPTHRYVPESTVDAQQLADIVDACIPLLAQA